MPSFLAFGVADAILRHLTLKHIARLRLEDRLLA